jgi:HEAT repeat protein
VPIDADPRLVELLEAATRDALAGPVRESEHFWRIAAEAARAVPADEVLAVAVTFARASEPALRATGAALAAQLAGEGLIDREEAVGVVGALLADPVADVVRISLHAIAESGAPQPLPAVAELAASPDAGVRLDAVHALYSCAGEPADAVAVAALVARAGDPDDAVRDWATFGLAERVDADSGALRDALAACLGDPVPDVREQAAFGLAARGDARAVEPLAALLAADEVSELVVEAAGLAADERLLDPLRALAGWSEPEMRDLVEAAMARCDPAARRRDDAFAAAVADALEQHVGRGVLDAVELLPLTRGLTRELVVRLDGGREAQLDLGALAGHPEVAGDPRRAAAQILERLRA